MDDLRENGICWRNRPIELLSESELKHALAESAMRLMQINGRPERCDTFLLGVVTGLAGGCILSVGAILLIL